MHQQHTEFKISRMCQFLEVSRSGYYEWLGRPPRPPTAAEQEVQDKIQRYFAQGRGTGSSTLNRLSLPKILLGAW